MSRRIRFLQILEQVPEDAAYYRRERKCRTLVVFVYDPETLLRETCLPSMEGTEPEVICAIAQPATLFS